MGEFILIVNSINYSFDKETLIKKSEFISEYIKNNKILSIVLDKNYFTDDIMKMLQYYIIDPIKLDSDSDTNTNTNTEKDIEKEKNIDTEKRKNNIENDFKFESESLIDFIFVIDYLKINCIKEIIKNILNSSNDISLIRKQLGFSYDFADTDTNIIQLEINDYSNNIISNNDMSLSVIIDSNKKIEEILQLSPCNDIVRFLKRKKTIKYISDDTVLKCQNCDTVFSLLLRKHHCRCCGRIFCYYCSNNYVPELNDMITEESIINNVKNYVVGMFIGTINGISGSSGTSTSTNIGVRVCNTCNNDIKISKIY